MSEEHQIVSRVREAKSDPDAADGFIREYMGFIKAETAKFTGRVPQEGRDDELSVAMLAFYESILAYDASRGPFLRFAALSMRSRLIDYARAENRQGAAVSYDEPAEEGGTALKDCIADENDAVAGAADRLSARKEIGEFSLRLSDFGLSLSDVADNCPRQERTFSACRRVIECAKAHPELLKELEKTKKLPMAALSELSGVERKTLERHRRYLLAILLAYTNGFEIIRRHLGQLKGGTR
jgi:RNA polymerase sigma factor